MIPCTGYIGEPGSGPHSQPFKIRIHKNVHLMMDIHAHLMATEIIGFLAGKWDAKENSKFLY
jgi:hypothetical protein